MKKGKNGEIYAENNDSVDALAAALWNVPSDCWPVRLVGATEEVRAELQRRGYEPSR